MLKRIRRGRERLFGDGRPVPLDRNAKVRIMVYARARMRRDAPGRHWGTISAKCMAVLETLLWGHHNAKSGLCFPSYETIAARAGCARSTVALAIKALEGAGILTWVNRLRRLKMPSPAGWRWRVLRASNGYRFTDQPAVTARPPISLHRSKSESQSGTINQASLLMDAPSRRDMMQDSPGLAAALERLEAARHRRGSEIPATA